ncbi:MAG: dihydropteroate synthase [Candidatus Omnitrophota bacterium]|jgi:dihydropteroate synthase|nr:MAG: dihydropteroate synthase [Candidatus Omnitrophota bacterium]
MRIIDIAKPGDLKNLMERLKVDPYGIKIMLPKGLSFAVKIDSLDSIAANILKQQMLSLGGDVALPRGILTGKLKNTDCLLLGNLYQLSQLIKKLKLQPFGLKELSFRLDSLLDSYQKVNFELDLPSGRMRLGSKPRIMGIINITPDSFSGDGVLKTSLISKSICLADIVDKAHRMIKDGADIIDVGGESSRPGSLPVSYKEELNRVIPVIKVLTKKTKAPISVDTYKPEVARQALDNGAAIVNDISGLRNRNMAKIIAKYKGAVVIMHMKGRPRSMQRNPVYDSVVDDISGFLKGQIDYAVASGIPANRIVIDPGIGFGKTTEHNLEILRRLREFRSLGEPVLIGPSRKAFIGKILKADCFDRVAGTTAACVLAAKNGANIVRVHDVRQIAQALKVSHSILN